jgi:hypothetical protein
MIIVELDTLQANIYKAFNLFLYNIIFIQSLVYQYNTETF